MNDVDREERCLRKFALGTVFPSNILYLLVLEHPPSPLPHHLHHHHLKYDDDEVYHNMQWIEMSHQLFKFPANWLDLLIKYDYLDLDIQNLQT